MGKKEKEVKKKGPLKKLSKCLFSWGSKRKSDKEPKDESPLQRAYSESSVANNISRSENLDPVTAEEDLDAANVGECSSSHRKSHFQFYCDISNTTELQNEDNQMPDLKLQEPSEKEKLFVDDLQDSTKPRITDLNTEICKSDTNDNCNDDVNNAKLRRFTVTAISESVDNNGIGKVHPKELEVAVLPKSEVKELNKSLFYQSNLNSADYARRDDEKDIEPQICQPSLVSNCSIKEEHSQAKNFQQSYDNTQQPEQENCQLNHLSHQYIDNIEENQSNFSSEICASDNKESNSEPLILQSSFIPANCASNVNSQHLEQSCQDNFVLASYISDVEKHSEQQDGQRNFNSTNLINNTGETHNQLQTDKLKFSIGNCEVDVQHLESQKFEEIHEGPQNTDLGRFRIYKLETETLPTDSKEQHIIEHLEELKANDNEESVTSQSDLNLDSETSHSNFNEVNRNGCEATTIKDASNLDFSTNKENLNKNELMPLSVAEEQNDYLNNKLSSSTHTSFQPFDTNKDSEISLQANDHNDHPSNRSKHDGECLKNKIQAQLVENYPSISVIKGTSEIGMTLVVLPYINSTVKNENEKVLSDLAEKGSNLSDVGKSLENLHIDEKNVSVPNNEADMQEEKNTSAKTTKPSRVPIRKLAERKHSVDKIQRLSIESETLNTNIKQKSVHNRSRTNSNDKSISKIPRKCV